MLLCNAEEEKLVATSDKSVLIVRPKFFIGSSGSVWASDYVRIRYCLFLVPPFENTKFSGLNFSYKREVHLPNFLQNISK